MSFSSTELIFINQILQIYEIAIYSSVFIFDFPTNIDLWNLYNFFFVCKEGFVYSFMIILADLFSV
jgi:hypothetical protein